MSVDPVLSFIIIIYFIFQQSSEGTITAPWDMELVTYTQFPLQA